MYDIKMADGRTLHSEELGYTNKGIRILMKNNKTRFIPYEAILWVDY